MKIETLFSTWWDSRTGDPLYFLGSIVGLLLVLVAVIFFIRRLMSRGKQKVKIKEEEEREWQSGENIVVAIEPEIGQPWESDSVDHGDVIEPQPGNANGWVGIEEMTVGENAESEEVPRVVKGMIDVAPNVDMEHLRSDEVTVKPKADIIVPGKEEQAKEKYIGYVPINVFSQTEPLNFPYVIMPKANCVIKFPRKGRVGRKGFKEEDFKSNIERYFKGEFQVFDDRFILTKNSINPFEPDFTLINEKNGINMFLDVEIDEPYEGLNDIEKRKPTHFQYSDINRNSTFSSRGWIVIRFAEIQVHLNPVACCHFIADVIRSVYSSFAIPMPLRGSGTLQPVKQWTRDEAEIWSKQRYREQYLGIKCFGVTGENSILENLSETDLGEKIEELVIEEPKFIPSIISAERTANPKLELINTAINLGLYLSFNFHRAPIIAKPIRISGGTLVAYCYVKNKELAFDLVEISNPLHKNNYYTLRVAGPTIGLDKISSAVNIAIKYKRYIRMKYTRASWTNMTVDKDTGELILNVIEAEESIRTISNVELAINVLAEEMVLAYNLNSNYITAYCNKREEQRTFRFDRIGEIEILDL